MTVHFMYGTYAKYYLFKYAHVKNKIRTDQTMV